MARLIGKDKALLEFRNVTKQSSTDADLRDVTFVFSQGTSYGVLGSHHSGMQNLLKLIYCAVVPDKGEVEVLGLSTTTQSQKIKSLVGVVPRFDFLEPDLSVYDQLRTFGKFFDLSSPFLRMRIRELVQQLELADFENQTIRRLSVFQKRKAGLARALIHSPKILIIDEICGGLDIKEQKWLFEQLLAIKNSGIDLIVATSDHTEVEKLCEYSIMLHRGILIEEGHPRSMIEKITGTHVVDFECKNGEVEYYFNKLNSEYEVHVAGSRLRVYLKIHQDLRALLALISSDNLLTRRPNLEDVYFKTTGQVLERLWHNSYL